MGFKKVEIQSHTFRLLICYRPAMPFGNRKKVFERNFLLQFKKCYPTTWKLALNYLGISQSLKLRILMENILWISLKLNFTPNNCGLLWVKYWISSKIPIREYTFQFSLVNLFVWSEVSEAFHRHKSGKVLIKAAPWFARGLPLLAAACVFDAPPDSNHSSEATSRGAGRQPASRRPPASPPPPPTTRLRPPTTGYNPSLNFCSSHTSYSRKNTVNLKSGILLS